MKAPQNRRVFVVGYGAATPLGKTFETTWQEAVKGKAGFRKLTRCRTESRANVVGEIPDWDPQMLEYLERLGTPTLFVLTKADKLNRTGQRRALEKLQKALGADEDQLLITSARTGLGVQELWDSIVALLEVPA